MKNKVQCTVLWVFLLSLSGLAYAQSGDAFADYKQEYDNQMADLLWRQYQEVSAWFDDAYREFPTVPRGALEAVAFQYTRFSPNVRLDTLEMDPLAIPGVYSIMGLTLHGKGVFRENVRLLASTTPYLLDDILWRPGVAVKAYACAFAQRQQKYRCYGDSLEQYKHIFMELCELPISAAGNNDFAMNSFLYMIYYFLCQEEYVRYGSPARQVDFERLFGKEYARLRSDRVEVVPGGGTRLQGTVPDYPNAVFVPAASCNYSSGRNGTTISSITIHYTQGTYAGSIAWFQNCSAKASAHYIIRSVDGQITQMVPEADKAWHVGVANGYTIGIEHEAYGNIYSYFTMDMYQSSANLVKNICSRRSNINPHGIFYRDTLDDGTVLNYGVHSLGGAASCTQIRGHQHYPSQTHTDPGQYWNWNLYYKLINENPVVTEMTETTGTFTDSGGASGDYGDGERRLFRIHVAGADSIALTFQNFALEPNYDFIWIYAGGSEFSPLLGRWNTQSPGRVVAAGDQMTVEFRSDCATHAPGWIAQWQSYSGNPNPPDTGDDDDDGGDNDDDDVSIPWTPDVGEPQVDNSIPLTVINNDAAQWIVSNFTASFSDSDDSGLKWRFYQILESDGVTWSARPEQGFLCENFDNVLNADIWLNNTSNPWTVQNGTLCQNNAAAEYAGVAAHYNGASHTACLYDFYLNFSGGDRCSFFFNCNNAPSLTSVFSGYEVCFDRTEHTVSVYRLILGVKRLLKTNTQVFFQTGTNYLCRVVFDSSTGEIVVLRHANRIIRAVDDALTTTSNSFVGFVTRNAAVSIDNFRIYGSRAATVPVSVGSDNACNFRQQAVNGLSRTKLRSIVVDRAYKFSSLSEKSLKVDYTPPPAVEHLALQTESVSQIDGMQVVNVFASWSSSSDANSGIRRYYYHNTVMTNPLLSSYWTDNGTSLSCNQSYAMSPNQMLIFGVVAENNAGVLSVPSKIMMAMPELEIHSKKTGDLSWMLNSGRCLRIEYAPSHDEEETMLTFSLWDISGRLLKNGEFRTSVSVNVADLSKGVYLLRVERGSELLMTEKVMILR